MLGRGRAYGAHMCVCVCMRACSECENFDLCASCRAAEPHPHHLWKEVGPADLIPLDDADLAMSTGANRRVGRVVSSSLALSFTSENKYSLPAAPPIFFKIHVLFRLFARANLCARVHLRLDSAPCPGELVWAALRNFENRWCLGSLPGQGPRRWSTYGEVRGRAEALGAAMRVHLGHAPRSAVGICGANSEDWVVADLAALVI